jgi:outer membrane biosynthesis protein TonB
MNLIAARNHSPFHKAISPSMARETRGYGNVMVRIVVEKSGNPYFVYASSPSSKVPDITPAAADVDTVREWQPF